MRTNKTIRAERFPDEIRAVLENGHRVELVPTKDGVRALRVRKDEIKTTRANIHEDNRETRWED